MKQKKVDVIITSPPYAEAMEGGTRHHVRADGTEYELAKEKRIGSHYSDDENNIGNLTYGKVDSVIFSPPYADENKKGAMKKVYVPKSRNITTLTYEERKTAEILPDGSIRYDLNSGRFGYSEDENNIGNYPYGKIENLLALAKEVADSPPAEKVLVWDSTAGFKPYQKYFSKDAIRHPAKANLHMLKWIIEHYTQEGDVILDPMAGTGSTGIMSALLNRNCILVEYEQKFVDMINDNIRLLETSPSLALKGKIVAFQGDARKLREALAEHKAEVDSIITSPPYSESLNPHNEGENPSGSTSEKRKRGINGAYSFDSNQIGNLPHGNLDSVDAVVTSPPYANRESDTKINDDDPQRMGYRQAGAENKDNIGNQQTATYLGSMLIVYDECYKVLKPNGYLILITKNFIRKKSVVRLDSDTIRLCERVGFILLERWFRKLTQLSFWIVNYRKKYPDAPKVDFEDILIFVKPSGNGQVDSVVFSPPYNEANRGGGIAQKGYKGKFGIDNKLQERHARPISDSLNQIGNLPYGKVDAIVSSPPYGIKETSQESSKNEIEKRIRKGIRGATIKNGEYHTGSGLREQTYSNDPNNLGNLPYGRIDS